MTAFSGPRFCDHLVSCSLPHTGPLSVWTATNSFFCSFAYVLGCRRSHSIFIHSHHNYYFLFPRPVYAHLFLFLSVFPCLSISLCLTFCVSLPVTHADITVMVDWALKTSFLFSMSGWFSPLLSLSLSLSNGKMVVSCPNGI